LILVISCFSNTAEAQEDSRVKLSKGQSVYVALYSQIYIGNRELPLGLSASLSIRNTDSQNSITVVGVDYYDSEGKLVKRHLSRPVRLKSMASTYFFVKTSDAIGG